LFVFIGLFFLFGLLSVLKSVGVDVLVCLPGDSGS